MNLRRLCVTGEVPQCAAKGVKDRRMRDVSEEFSVCLGSRISGAAGFLGGT
jgi:hypothetical protein